MPRVNIKTWIAIGAVALAQTAVLAGMVWSRVNLLEHGREITMKVVPVDPRDLFRGDYVVLGYELSPLKPTLEEVTTSLPSLHVGAPIYVTVAPDAENAWKPVAFASDHPEKVDATQAVLKGRVADAYGCTKEAGFCLVNVRYGIESYFVPEGQGLKLEQLVRERKVEALVAVAESGDAALKGLLVDGVKVSEEPPL